MNELAMKMTPVKRRGEWAELKFMTAAAERGFCVTKPWGETTGYDFVVEHGRRFLRVQVKSTAYKSNNSYVCNVHSSQGIHLSDPFDFLAAYIVPEDMWFIVPGNVLCGRYRISLHPRREKSKYGMYRESWESLKAPELSQTKDGLK
jgi:PD-(D/E)XK nuclease superfamily protein